MTTLLLDGDIIAYKIACAVECPTDWGDGVWTLHANIDEAKEAVRGYVERVSKKLSVTKVWVCFSDDKNFRKEVLPDYKANRKDTRKPLLLKPLISWMKEFYPSKVFEGLEADDVMGILSTANAKDKPVIVSVDKDLKQIPGLVFNPDKDEEPTAISEAEADKQFYRQVLSGDVTDNYKGCPGIGAGGADEFLNNPFIWDTEERVFKTGKRKGQSVMEWKKRPLKEGETLWDGIVSFFKREGLTEDDALVQARVARILRSSDYDIKKMKLKLWEPSK